MALSVSPGARLSEHSIKLCSRKCGCGVRRRPWWTSLEVTETSLLFGIGAGASDEARVPVSTCGVGPRLSRALF